MAELQRLSASQPNVSTNGMAAGDDFDSYFLSAQHRNREMCKEHSMSDPTLTPEPQHRLSMELPSEERVTSVVDAYEEQDSGIAVTERSSIFVVSAVIYFKYDKVYTECNTTNFHIYSMFIV